MLCVARCNMSDWPEGQIRDVDPKHETIAGWLRAQYIVPVRIVRRDAEPKAAKQAKADE